MVSEMVSKLLFFRLCLSDIRAYGEKGFRAMVSQCIRRAEYAVTLLAEADCKAWRHPHAIT
uniref:Uncharacterized protein n=1 Tax=Candidatus Kentrum sp. TUN TaxID=2126343 RepID=A0A451A5U8_9GAMM|nr:MAG: hypothetical protein BECKTUN1418F_GA0071002_12544 [Candidatus Kentron sp. TUN]VFK70343.1 MAG: hypothetical protein BECKTUN1418E_GA0071001_12574 [Candidatus Kentron sp. TUN]